MKHINLSKILSLFALAAGIILVAHPAFATLGQPTPGGLGLQEHATPMKERMEHFHNDLLMPIITGTTLFVLALLIYVVIRFNAKANPKPSKTTHNTMLEVVWTLVPVLILIVVVVPSMKMLYYVDKAKNPEMTLKVIGNQWYWGYEYPDHGGISITANMVAEKDLKEGQPRLLATDNPVVLPIDTDIQILTTAADVLHSWAMPSFGVKMDAVPGRINETWVRIEKEGIFYGQCSEICGINHALMPIEVHAVSKQAFAEWVVAQGGKMPEPKVVDAGAVPAAAAVSGQAEAATPVTAADVPAADTPAETAPAAPAAE